MKPWTFDIKEIKETKQEIKNIEWKLSRKLYDEAKKDNDWMYCLWKTLAALVKLVWFHESKLKAALELAYREEAGVLHRLCNYLATGKFTRSKSKVAPPEKDEKDEVYTITGGGTGSQYEVTTVRDRLHLILDLAESRRERGLDETEEEKHKEELLAAVEEFKADPGFRDVYDGDDLAFIGDMLRFIGTVFEESSQEEGKPGFILCIEKKEERKLTRLVAQFIKQEEKKNSTQGQNAFEEYYRVDVNGFRNYLREISREDDDGRIDLKALFDKESRLRKRFQVKKTGPTERPVADGGMLTAELYPDSLIGALERHFGSKRGCDISGTTTDMIACFELACSYWGAPLKLCHKLTPLIILSRNYHHTILECAIPTMVCYPEIQYVPGYYPSLLPKETLKAYYTQEGSNEIVGLPDWLSRNLKDQSEERKENFVLIFSDRWQKNYAMFTAKNVIIEKGQLSKDVRKYFSISKAIARVTKSKCTLKFDKDSGSAWTTNYRSVCVRRDETQEVRGNLKYPKKPDEVVEANSAYQSLAYLLKRFHAVRNYMNSRIWSKPMKAVAKYGGTADFLPVAIHLLRTVDMAKPKDTGTKREIAAWRSEIQELGLHTYVIGLYKWSQVDPKVRKEAQDIVGQAPKVQRTIEYITEASKGFEGFKA